jgi:nucleoside-diphosphate-sugar epimerase
VDDLVALIVALVPHEPAGRVMTGADERPSGYSWQEVFAAAARAVGNTAPRFFHAPAALLHTVAAVGDVGRLFGAANMLSSQKLRELRHADWSVPVDEWAQAPGWSPRYTLDAGFQQTVEWYREAGWLQRS